MLRRLPRPRPPRRRPSASSFSEGATPFAETANSTLPESETERLIAEAFAELRDESFDEAVAYLAEETEQAVGERFTDESPSSGAERERYADAQLPRCGSRRSNTSRRSKPVSPVWTSNRSDEQQLDEVLDRLDPQTGELTPAGEEFIGKLVRKAKKAVKFVVKTAKNVASRGKVAGAVLGPVLKKLRGLINPLLRRVLSFAIGRLPAPLQPAARTLAARITSEAAEAKARLRTMPMSPANLTDVEALAESFDAALAEAVTGDTVGEFEGESFEDRDREDKRARAGNSRRWPKRAAC